MQRKVGQVGRVEFVFEQAVGRVREMLWCGKTATEKKKKIPLKVSERGQIRNEDNSIPSDSIRRQKEH